MIEILQHIVAFIFALGILITFHEFGHYWVARKCDVKILRFSVGFGKPLYKRYFGDDKTEFVIAAIPLGGYVKMLDEREGNVSQADLPRAFNRKSLGQRFAIVFAGPLFNYIFAVFAFWLVFMIGVTGYKPVVGQVEEGSIADRAGLQTGSEILEVNDVRTRTWASVMDRSVNKIIEADPIKFLVRDSNMIEQNIVLNTQSISIDDIAGGNLMRVLGIGPERIRIPARIAEVITGRAADQAGFQSGDLVLKVDDQAIEYWDEWAEYISSHPEQSMVVVIERDGEQHTLKVHPQIHPDDKDNIPRVGVIADYPKQLNDDADRKAIESYGIVEGLFKSVTKTWDVSLMSLRVLGKMITGQASVKNLSGPISIAQYAGYTAAAGVAAYISFLGIVSVSLGLLNLFPIPLLDGGHLMYYLIEFVKGGPVSESTQLIGQQLGLALLLCLMSLVFYNDIVRLIG